jgi:hypothetical protein
MPGFVPASTHCARCEGAASRLIASMLAHKIWKSPAYRHLTFVFLPLAVVFYFKPL